MGGLGKEDAVQAGSLRLLMIMRRCRFTLCGVEFGVPKSFVSGLSGRSRGL